MEKRAGVDRLVQGAAGEKKDEDVERRDEEQQSTGEIENRGASCQMISYNSAKTLLPSVLCRSSLGDCHA